MTTSLTPDEILEKLSCYFDSKHNFCTDKNVRSLYQLKRRFRILDKYERKKQRVEQSVLIYTTSRDEKLYYTCDGKSYGGTDGRQYPYIETHIIDQGGNKISFITTEDIWNMFYVLSEKDMSLVACVALVFYHLQYNEAYKNHRVVFENEGKGPFEFWWRLPCFDDNVISSLNEMIGDITIGKCSSISFEAFIYYCELEADRHVLLPHDSRYEYDKRQETFKIIIWIAAYYMGAISYGKLLDYFKDFLPGTLGITRELISATTKGATHDAAIDIKHALEKEGIEFLEKSIMKVGRVRIVYLLCIPKAKFFVVRGGLKDYETRELKDTDWKTIDISEITDACSFNRCLQSIRSRVR